MSATVPERIEELWERATDRAKAIAAEDSEADTEGEAGISDIVAVLVEEVAAIGKRIDDAPPMGRI